VLVSLIYRAVKAAGFGYLLGVCRRAGDEFPAGLGEVAALAGDGLFVVDLDQDGAGEP
jgi:hypothetical protein